MWGTDRPLRKQGFNFPSITNENVKIYFAAGQFLSTFLNTRHKRVIRNCEVNFSSSVFVVLKQVPLLRIVNQNYVGSKFLALLSLVSRGLFHL